MSEIMEAFLIIGGILFCIFAFVGGLYFISGKEVSTSLYEKCVLARIHKGNLEECQILLTKEETK